MALKYIKDNDDMEVFYEQNQPENTDYLHKTKQGILNSISTLSDEEVKINFRLNRETNKEKQKKLLSRLEKIEKRKQELNDWYNLKFPRPTLYTSTPTSSEFHFPEWSIYNIIKLIFGICLIVFGSIVFFWTIGLSIGMNPIVLMIFFGIALFIIVVIVYGRK